VVSWLSFIDVKVLLVPKNLVCLVKENSKNIYFLDFFTLKNAKTYFCKRPLK
jgi:hypothetical protein